MNPRLSRSLWFCPLLLASCTCADHGAGEGTSRSEHELPALSITHFTDRTELFVEFRALVRGQDSPFAAHLTQLSDFKPVSTGRVAVILSGGGAPEERFEAQAPQVPGIFRPVARPAHASARQLAIVVDVDGTGDRHELGAVSVYANAQEARAAASEEAAGAPRVTFLKEQQWRAEFATARVGERALRASVIANGVLRPRSEGEARITAPVGGRLVTSGRDFPRIGMEVERDQLLANMAPRLGGDVDSASLTLAVERARIDLDRGLLERERLEGLFAENAVPERRLVEARHQEAAAQAELSAARSRLGQYQGTQRAAGGGAAGRVSIRSPIKGTVVQVHAAPGAFMEEGRDLFRVVDLDRLWLEVQIPETDIGRARNATGAWFEVEGFERPFEIAPNTGGRVVALGGVVDPQTRAAPLLLELPNPDRQLRVGMFARVRVLTGASVMGPAVPISAVVEEGGQDVAYVQIDGEAFERRVLRLGVRDGEYVQVLEGLGAQERVVTRGAYLVRLAASSGAIPAHGHAH